MSNQQIIVNVEEYNVRNMLLFRVLQGRTIQNAH